jgi:2,4-dienoyl-CoA reductase-like NADH-dependent reductase (Old Yellow Enzyme family)
MHVDVAGIDRLIEMMDRGDFDLIAIGRALIANPNWAGIVREGRLEDLRAYEPKMLDTLA